MKPGFVWLRACVCALDLHTSREASQASCLSWEEQAAAGSRQRSNHSLLRPEDAELNPEWRVLRLWGQIQGIHHWGAWKLTYSVTLHYKLMKKELHWLWRLGDFIPEGTWSIGTAFHFYFLLFYTLKLLKSRWNDLKWFLSNFSHSVYGISLFSQLFSLFIYFFSQNREPVLNSTLFIHTVFITVFMYILFSCSFVLKVWFTWEVYKNL